MRPTEKNDEKIRKEVVARELNDSELNGVSGGSVGSGGMDDYHVQKEDNW